MQCAQDRVQWEAFVSHEVAYKLDSAGQGPAFKGICYMGADRSALILWDLRLSLQCSRWQSSGMSHCVQGLYFFDCWPWRWRHDNMTVIQNAGSYVAWSDPRWLSSCSLNVSSLLCVLLQENEDQCDAFTTEMEVQVPDETEDSDSETLGKMGPSNTE